MPPPRRATDRAVPALGLTIIVPYLVATVSSVAAIVARRAGDARQYQLLEREIEAINRFPGQNPNPVLRVTTDGRLLYANASSEPITSALGLAVGYAARSLTAHARSVRVTSGG